MFRHGIKRPRLPSHEDDDEKVSLRVSGHGEKTSSEHNLEKLVFGDANFIDKFQPSSRKRLKKRVRVYHKEDEDENETEESQDGSEQSGDESKEDDDVKAEESPDEDESEDDVKSKESQDESDSDDDTVLKTRRVKWADRDKIPKNEYTRKHLQISRQSDSSDDSSDDDGDDITRHAADYLFDKPDTLIPGVIDMKRVKDLNHSSREEGSVLRAVEFHPNATLAFTGGKAGILSLFQVDGETNPKLQSIQIRKFPISTAHFSADGYEVMMGSFDSGVLHYYDMMASKVCKVPWQKAMGTKNMGQFTMSPDNKIIAFHGTYGQILLLNAKSKEWMDTLKVNNHVKAIAFNTDGSRMYVHGHGGEVNIYDMNTRHCIHKFYDDGCVNGTSICVSPDNNRIVCGSDSGVVNVYDASNIWVSAPKPSKIFLNLTTSIFNTKINHSNELMVMSSDVKDNAIKLVHLKSMSVYSNFPFNRMNMKRPLCVDFSLNSRYLAIANNRGKALLYRLKHYKNY